MASCWSFVVSFWERFMYNVANTRSQKANNEGVKIYIYSMFILWDNPLNSYCKQVQTLLKIIQTLNKFSQLSELQIQHWNLVIYHFKAMKLKTNRIYIVHMIFLKYAYRSCYVSLLLLSLYCVWFVIQWNGRNWSEYFGDDSPLSDGKIQSDTDI